MPVEYTMHFVTLSLQFYYHILFLDETMKYEYVLVSKSKRCVCIFRCVNIHNMFTKQASLFLSAYKLHSVHHVIFDINIKKESRKSCHLCKQLHDPVLINIYSCHCHWWKKVAKQTSA